MEFREQIWPFKDRLYRLALRLVKDQAEAEDVVQEVLIKVWRQGTELKLIQNLEAWCIRLTRNQALDKLKSGYRKRKSQLDTQVLQIADNTQPDVLLESQDTMQRIKRLINQLPEQQRAVVQLRDVEGLSYQEICESLDLPMSQVKSHLFRARQKLRQRIEKSGL